MFTYVKLKNFMSFKDVCFDFRKGSKGAKKFVSVYGENGSGKSNFVMAISFLRKSLISFEMVSNAEKIMELTQEKNYPNEFMGIFSGITSTDKYIKDCRMIECDEPTYIEYGFECNNHEGIYSIAFKDRFLYERLYYYSGKQRGNLYEINFLDGEKSIKISNKLFKTKKFEEDIYDEISKYWGKHSLLSILNKEKEEKNETYIQDNVLEYVFDIVKMAEDCMIYADSSRNYLDSFEVEKPENVLKGIEKGKIKKENEEVLDRTERIVRTFFTQAYADIKDVFYERKEEQDIITYRLFVRKIIGDQIRTIGFEKESAGTRRVLNIFRSLLGAFCGVTVVYDEIDNGIHDLLLKNIIESMVDDITGQLIITTHNTYLLEKTDIKSVYLINTDYKGDKEVKCLDEYPRIQESNNPRLMYLRGLFGGVPITDVLDYDEIISELEVQAESGGINA